MVVAVVLGIECFCSIILMPEDIKTKWNALQLFCWGVLGLSRPSSSLVQNGLVMQLMEVARCRRVHASYSLHPCKMTGVPL